MLWFDPIIIHKKGFKGDFPVSKYFAKRIYYSLLTVAAAALCKLICTFVLSGFGWLSVALHALICLLTVPATLLAATAKTEENGYVLSLAKTEISKIVSKLRKKS